MSMWIWTCSACGDTFKGWTKREAEGKFTEHAREAHNPKLIVSMTEEGSPDA